ncbi:DNA kinase/phosphatase Pnk1, partial [Dipsacomyces acuminosporus]
MTRSLDQGEAHDAPSQDNKRSSPGTGDSAIHPFFQLKRPRTNSGQAQASAGLQWREIGRTWIGCYKEPKPAARFAAFDLDNTLICVKGKYKFPKDSDDWVFLHPDVPRLLRNMHGQGYKIVIISNQNGLKPAKNSTKLTKSAVDYRLKISKIAEQLD